MPQQHQRTQCIKPVSANNSRVTEVEVKLPRSRSSYRGRGPLSPDDARTVCSCRLRRGFSPWLALYYRSPVLSPDAPVAHLDQSLAPSEKGSPYSITERRVPELIPVLGSQPAGDVSHKPGGRLPLLSARPAVTPATLKRAASNFGAWWTEEQWARTVCLRLSSDSVTAAIWTRGPSAPESSTLTTRLPSHPSMHNYWDTSSTYLPTIVTNHRHG